MEKIKLRLKLAFLATSQECNKTATRNYFSNYVFKKYSFMVKKKCKTGFSESYPQGWQKQEAGSERYVSVSVRT